MSFFSFQDIISCTTGILIMIALLLTLRLVTQPMAAAADLPNVEELTEAIESAERDLRSLEQRIEQKQETIAELGTGIDVTQGEVDRKRERVGAIEDRNRDVKADVGRLERELDDLKPRREGVKQGNKTLAEEIEEAREALERAKKRRLTRLEGEAKKTPLLVECSAARIAVGQIEALNRATEAEKLAEFTGPDRLQEFFNWAARRPKEREYFVLLVRPEAVGDFLTIQGTLAGNGYDTGWDVWPPDRSLFATP